MVRACWQSTLSTRGEVFIHARKVRPSHRLRTELSRVRQHGISARMLLLRVQGPVARSVGRGGRGGGGRVSTKWIRWRMWRMFTHSVAHLPAAVARKAAVGLAAPVAVTVRPVPALPFVRVVVVIDLEGLVRHVPARAHPWVASSIA